MERNVFTFWRGKKYSLIELLRKLMILHSNEGKNYKFHLLDRENITSMMELPECFDKMKIAHQADYVRLNVIYKYGGIWLDADTLVMESFDTLFDILEAKGAFFIKENNLLFWNGVFGMKKEHPILKEIIDNMNDVLSKKKEKLNWTDIGNIIFEKVLNKYKTQFITLYGLNNVYPVNWNMCVKEFIKKPYDNYKRIKRDFQPFIALVNSVYKELDGKNVLNMDIPLTYFLRRSIQNLQKYGSSVLFDNIYRFGIWNDNLSSIPLSGPGSSLVNTEETRQFIDTIVTTYEIKSVVDLGCGDVNWVSQTKAFSLDYTGIDISSFIIEKDREKYPEKSFLIKDITKDEIPEADLFICRDVLFHLSIKDILLLFENSKGKFKYILFENNTNETNDDKFNEYHFCPRNLFLEPFNKSKDSIIDQFFEKRNKRDLFLFDSRF